MLVKGASKATTTGSSASGRWPTWTTSRCPSRWPKWTSQCDGAAPSHSNPVKSITITIGTEQRDLDYGRWYPGRDPETSSGPGDVVSFGQYRTDRSYSDPFPCLDDETRAAIHDYLAIRGWHLGPSTSPPAKNRPPLQEVPTIIDVPPAPATNSNQRHSDGSAGSAGSVVSAVSSSNYSRTQSEFRMKRVNTAYRSPSRSPLPKLPMLPPVAPPKSAERRTVGMTKSPRQVDLGDVSALLSP
ncbi:uncharacterized protein MYCFIDRAFT_211784 [Pseudocercospora fijiensis CIRAD86]|uniref:Uncharacterized protein n=1 Tax=Pseudocercospora fijiensis (strain CIRAD86) TaxID=383855 RepID=M2ZQ73_PSEFD|nr:uncharacterized protein MYCFIDRAFT_211784 [Pseudocercospora fijiensis CIRAD86]EME81214.1 hypothetical protein MYCFIDRAFT_211784 [Pseudocercospora fijiensis CIRAD86]